MPLHHIEIGPNGKVTLGEFVRLAGLVAAGAADLHDLAVEFADAGVTLDLGPDELASTVPYGWYMASFGAYWIAEDAREHQGRMRYEHLIGIARMRYAALIEEAAGVLADAAEQAAVRRVELAQVLPFRRPKG